MEAEHHSIEKECHLPSSSKPPFLGFMLFFRGVTFQVISNPLFPSFQAMWGPEAEHIDEHVPLYDAKIEWTYHLFIKVLFLHVSIMMQNRDENSMMKRCVGHSTEKALPEVQQLGFFCLVHHYFCFCWYHLTSSILCILQDHSMDDSMGFPKLPYYLGLTREMPPSNAIKASLTKSPFLPNIGPFPLLVRSFIFDPLNLAWGTLTPNAWSSTIDLSGRDPFGKDRTFL